MRSPKAGQPSPKVVDIKAVPNRQEETGSPAPQKSVLELLEESPRRIYQFTNLQDITIDDFNSNGGHLLGLQDGGEPKVLKYFLENNRFQATSVLEESVINNEIMKQNAFLKNFSPGFVEEMLGCEEHIRAVVYMPNQVIVHQGAPGDSMMVIAKGMVEVAIGGRPVNRLGEGSFFGELVLVGAAHIRTATITSVTFCDVRVIYRKAFMQIISKYPADQAMLATLVKTRLNMVETVAPAVALNDRFRKARRGPAATGATKAGQAKRLSVFTRSAVHGQGTDRDLKIPALKGLPAVQDEPVVPGPLTSTAWAARPDDDEEPESILGSAAFIAAGGVEPRPRGKRDRAASGAGGAGAGGGAAGALSGARSPGSARASLTAGPMGKSSRSRHRTSELGEGPRMPKIGWQVEDDDESAGDIVGASKSASSTMKSRGGAFQPRAHRTYDIVSAA